MKKTLFTLLAIAFISITSAFAYPVTIYTSCDIHNTDTELWDGLSEEEIKAELEKICSQNLKDPTGPYSL